MNLNEFHIQCAKSNATHNKALDYYFARRNFKYKDIDWKICMMYYKKYSKESVEYCKKAAEALDD